MYSAIKTLSLLKGPESEHRPKSCSPLPVMVKSSNEWNIVERDVKQKTTNKQPLWSLTWSVGAEDIGWSKGHCKAEKEKSWRAWEWPFDREQKFVSYGKSDTVLRNDVRLPLIPVRGTCSPSPLGCRCWEVVSCSTVMFILSLFTRWLQFFPGVVGFS
jgi:hypothetical protein